MFGLDPLYFVLPAPGFMLALWAQWHRQWAVRQGQAVTPTRRITGAQAAAEVLQFAGITGVAIEPGEDILTDHYDARHKVLRLRPDVYYGQSLAALGLAAHEVGHALQDATRYPLLALRNGLVPLASLGSHVSWLLILAGCTLLAVQSIWGAAVLLLGMGAFPVTVLFQLVNLPIEFDASKRVRGILVHAGMITTAEDPIVRQLLRAAALTYVAATLTAVLTRLYSLRRIGLLGGSPGKVRADCPTVVVAYGTPPLVVARGGARPTEPHATHMRSPTQSQHPKVRLVVTEGHIVTFNTLKTTILLAALTGLLMLMGHWLGGTSGLLIGFLLAAAMNFGSYWFSDQIALRMAGAQEVSYAEAPDLHTLVAQLAHASGLPKPRVAVIDSDAPNAFATGRNAHHGLVAVTTGILRLLNHRELTAVLAHELGHIRNRDILVSSIAATIAGAVTMIAQMGQFALLFGGARQDDEEGGGSVLGGLLMLIVAPLAATIIQLAISRAREFGADRTGAYVSHDPEALATALEKLEAYAQRIPLPVNPAVSHLFIVQPLTGFSVQKLFSTHPPTAERVARLRHLAQQMARTPLD